MNILGDIETILGESEFDDFIEYIKSENTERILDNFEIGSFENDSDYIVLKMKQTSELYKTLGLINKGLRTKYEVVSEYSYTPHISSLNFNQEQQGNISRILRLN